jgi:hypothetical protein
MQNVVVASRCDVLDVYYCVRERLTGHCVPDVALHSDVSLSRTEPSKHTLNNIIQNIFIFPASDRYC